MQMFIWNNIFFSMGFDVKDHYKDFGGDFAAHVAPVNTTSLTTHCADHRLNIQVYKYMDGANPLQI